MNELSSHTLRVQVESQPFLDDPDGAELFYAAVGRAIRLFGRFEMHFVAAIRAIQQLPEFVHELPQEPTFPPATLRQQMRLWRKCFHSIERLSPLRSAALGFRELYRLRWFVTPAPPLMTPLSRVFHGPSGRGAAW